MSDGFVHLKTPKPKKGEGKVPEWHEPDYPHGTRVSLPPEHVEKLYGDDVPEAGEEHEIHAKARVKGIDVDDDGGKRVELQITHMKRPKMKARSVREDLDDAAEMAEKRETEKKEAKK